MWGVPGNQARIQEVMPYVSSKGQIRTVEESTENRTSRQIK